MIDTRNSNPMRGRGELALRPRVLIAAVGDANKQQTWGGIPYHILMYGRALGVIDVGLPLETSASHWKSRRLAWNVYRLATKLERGGYQFSDAFLAKLWHAAALLPNDTVINTFQLYPSRLFAHHRGAKLFFIDQTLSQAISLYGLAVGTDMAKDAIARERKQYHDATGVITQSSWAARDVIENYGVPQERVHVAIPGANIDRLALAIWENGLTFKVRTKSCPLRLVFVGKEWQRKGLDRLLRASAIARSQGAAVEVVVIGIDAAAVPPDLARSSNTLWVGFIDKQRDLSRFLNTIANCDVGCLLSRAEAGGISLREFCRLGLPTLAPNVGGSPEYVLKEASDLIDSDASDETIAAIIMRLANDREDLDRRRRLAFDRRHEASWDRAIEIIGQVAGRYVPK